LEKVFRRSGTVVPKSIPGSPSSRSLLYRSLKSIVFSISREEE
jgi:hypothetical protein